jgi:hypothetical protein
VRPTNELEVIEADLQSRFRTGVGILLYLINYPRPEIINVVTDLAKCMDGVTFATNKEMLRFRFVVDIQLFCLKIEPKKDEEECDFLVYSVSDWAEDSENRIRITGFIIYLLEIPICWSSKGQKGITLSRNEA